MKKGTKIWLMIVLILALLGSVLCVSAFAMGITSKDLMGMARSGQFQMDGWWDEHDEMSTHHHEGLDKAEHHSDQTVNTVYSKLVIDLDFGHLFIRSTDLDEVYMESDSDDEQFFDLEKNDTVITIRSENHSILSGLHVPETTLYLPEEMEIEHIFLDIDAGECIIENRLNVQTLEVDVDAGLAKIQNMYANRLDLSCDAGSIIYEGEAISGGEADVDAGKIELMLTGKRESDYNYEIDVDAGALVINDQQYSKKDYESFIRNDAKATWSLSCDAGKIEMKVNP